MTLLNTINVGGTDYSIAGAAVLGGCVTPAGSEIKVCTFSDNFKLKAGYLLLVKFTYANTYGDGSTTYPKLQVNGVNYVMRRADGNYLQSGEWDNNATLTFLFDGTDFILPAGSGSARGSGVPLGAILAIHSNQVPDGYLPCDGAQFDETQYPALYTFLGDNHTPDLREVTLKGIGETGRTVGNHVKSGGLTVGEFIDDRIQQHKHNEGDNFLGGYPSAGTVLYRDFNGVDNDTKGVVEARVGDTTEVKAVGENYCIKATSGLEESQQDYVLEALVEASSYSTNEVATGKKWIDGKTIYRKVLGPVSLLLNAGFTTSVGVPNLDKMLSMTGFAYNNLGQIGLPYFDKDSSNNISAVRLYYDSIADKISIMCHNDFSTYTAYITAEYTKTTPST